MNGKLRKVYPFLRSKTKVIYLKVQIKNFCRFMLIVETYKRNSYKSVKSANK
jgi:hypothetical protein